MEAKYLMPLIIGLFLCAFIKSDDDDKGQPYKIDRSVKEKASALVHGSIAGMGDSSFIYMNSMKATIYFNDEVYRDTLDKADEKLFESFYFWRSDTLCITGGFGLAEGMGFYVKIHHQKAFIYAFGSSDKVQEYMLHPSDPPAYRIEVPCTSSDLTLAETPDKAGNGPIYGHINFSSEPFYVTDRPGIIKIQIKDMSVYFRSIYMNLDSLNHK